MTTLTKEQFIYLLYAKAYAKAAEAGTITKGSIKSCLPSECKKKAEKLYDALKQQGLIKTTDKQGNTTIKNGRFSITDEGNQALVANLTKTDHRDFTTSKSYKVLSTALTCLLNYIQEMPEFSPDELSEEMTFEVFQEKFKALYFEERRQQELRGVVTIHSDELCQKFASQNLITKAKLAQYFELLKANGEILAVIEKGQELIQWVE